MNRFFYYLWISDNLGSGLGLILNFLLLQAILKTTTDKTRPYSYLFLTSAIFDIFFSIVEFATQHQLLIKNGMFLVMPHGVESIFGEWSYPTFMAPHSLVVIHGILILPALCHYRYLLITSGNTVNPLLIVRNVCISFLAGTILGICLGYGVYQASFRGYDYYFQYVTHEWIAEDGETPYRYACDMRDWGTMAYFYGGFVLTAISVQMAGTYTLKAWKAVNIQQSSDRTKELQRQFTRSLIAQTVNAGIFAIFPIGLVCIAMQWRLDGKMIGTAVMSPLSWLPSANAILTIYLIKAYRRWVMRLFGCRPRRVDGMSSDMRTGKSAVFSSANKDPTDPGSLAKEDHDIII